MAHLDGGGYPKRAQGSSTEPCMTSLRLSAKLASATARNPEPFRHGSSDACLPTRVAAKLCESIVVALESLGAISQHQRVPVALPIQWLDRRGFVDHARIVEQQQRPRLGQRETLAIGASRFEYA